MASTIKDLARYTGLSLATISKYLNGGSLRPYNRTKIEEAVKKLDFHINDAARALKSKHSRLIGFVIPELNNLFVASVISVAEDILRRHGYATIICDCNTDEKLEKEAVDFLIQKGAEGIVNMPVCQDGSHLKTAIERNISIILVDRMIAPMHGIVDGVIVDNVDASYSAVDYLMQEGHEKIGIIVGPSTVFTSHERLLGYRRAIVEHGFSPEDALIAYSDYSIEGGYKSMVELLGQNSDMSAVFVTNYEMTLGAIIALNELGVIYPEDISFIGFDNMQLSQLVRPRLTIVSQPLEEIGSKIAEKILKRLDGNSADEESEIITLKTKLLIGDTVRSRN